VIAKAWTADESALLRELAPTHTAEELAPIFGRSRFAIHNRAAYEGITTRPKQRSLTVESVREWLSVDVGGTLRWLKSPRSDIPAGSEAGALNVRQGYRQVSFAGKSIPAHRLIFALYHGRFPDPKKQIDHINGNRTDNRKENLRECTQAENLRNQGAKPWSSTGIKGVSNDGHKARPWFAQICTDGKRKWLGRFATADEAKAAYNAACRLYHGEFARVNG
jgi:hypothetical protein